jgi:SHAQKYF class myb-like DNA-binding protein
MKKIDAFKRELPLCMLLITDAIEMLKMEVIKCKRSSDGSVMEDFTPLKDDAAGEEDKGADFVNNESNKKDWLSSVQLWTDTTAKTTISDQKQRDNTISQLKLRTEEEDLSLSENSIHLGECGNRVGAFVPYKGESRGSVRTELKKPRDITRFPELSLRRSINEMGSCNISLKSNESGRIGSGSSLLQTESHQQTCRKQRRCWSPDLHRRFIDALQQLGGSQVATPKQIRELMRVDGLTNDEVKSHLQKYRLHIQKTSKQCNWPNGRLMDDDTRPS